MQLTCSPTIVQKVQQHMEHIAYNIPQFNCESDAEYRAALEIQVKVSVLMPSLELMKRSSQQTHQHKESAIRIHCAQQPKSAQGQLREEWQQLHGEQLKGGTKLWRLSTHRLRLVLAEADRSECTRRNQAKH